MFRPQDADFVIFYQRFHCSICKGTKKTYPGLRGIRRKWLFL